MTRCRAFGLLAAGTALGALLGAAGLAAAQDAFLIPAGLPQGKLLGAIDLGNGFPHMKGYMLNMRYVTLAPGSGRAMHSHAAFPEILYVASGVLTEQLDDGKIRSFPAGSTTVSVEGSNHLIINLGKEPAALYSASVARTPAQAVKL